MYFLFFVFGVVSQEQRVEVYTNANQTTYTISSTFIDGNPVKALMMGKPPMTSMELVGWTSAFAGHRVIDLATEFGHTFYFLTNSESLASANTTLWAVHPSYDLIRITNTSTDGWVLTIIAVYYNRLYAIGYMPPSLTRHILTFGEQPSRPMRPMILSGFPAVSHLLSATDIVWSGIGSSVSLVSSTGARNQEVEYELSETASVKSGVNITILGVCIGCSIAIVYLLYTCKYVTLWRTKLSPHKSPCLPTRVYTKLRIDPNILNHRNIDQVNSPVKDTTSSAVSPYIKENIGFTVPKENDV
jgi:hypothetical protein